MPEAMIEEKRGESETSARHQPSVCVVVLNWNGADDTEECVDSLLRGSYAGQDILIVDNGSTDGSAGRLRARFPDVEVLETGDNLGYAGGNNAGIEQALKRNADYIFILNNDTVVDADCISQVVLQAESNPSAGAIGCFVYQYSQPQPFLYAGIRMQDRLDLPFMGEYYAEDVTDRLDSDEPIVVNSAHGCAFVVKREVVERIGGFDDGFFAMHEEVDYCMRIREAGWSVIAVPRAKVWHKVSATFSKQSDNRVYYDIRNRVHYYLNRAMAQRRSLPVRFWAEYMLRNLARSAKWVLLRDLGQAGAVVQGTWDGIRRVKGRRPSRRG